MATVQAEARAARAPAWGQTLRALLARRPVLTAAFALAAGVAIGSLASAFVTGVSRRHPEVRLPASGTMAPLPEEEQEDAVATESISVPGGRFEVGARPGPTGAGLFVRGEAAAPVEVVVEFDPGGLTLVSLEPPATEGMRTEIGPGRVVVTGQGPLRFELSWKPVEAAPAPVRVAASGSGVQSEARLEVVRHVADSVRNR
jgi:hypothetical protein